jgi:predicted Zn-dependent protease with MMP-like domain
MRLSMKEFELLVERVVDSIPEEFLPYLENTVFIVEESSLEGLMGYYEGSGALHAGEGFPDRITLYKQSHERAARTMDELVEEVRRTILHEVGHHFGMDEGDLPY